MRSEWYEVVAVVADTSLPDLLAALGPEGWELHGADAPCTCSTPDRYVPAILTERGLAWRCAGTIDVERVAYDALLGHHRTPTARCEGGTLGGAVEQALASRVALDRLGIWL
jgi:hypothetical protein